MGRRVFTRGFKLEAVKLVKGTRRVGMHRWQKTWISAQSVVGRWVRESSTDKATRISGPWSDEVG